MEVYFEYLGNTHDLVGNFLSEFSSQQLRVSDQFNQPTLLFAFDIERKYPAPMLSKAVYNLTWSVVFSVCLAYEYAASALLTPDSLRDLDQDQVVVGVEIHEVEDVYIDLGDDSPSIDLVSSPSGKTVANTVPMSVTNAKSPEQKQEDIKQQRMEIEKEHNQAQKQEDIKMRRMNLEKDHNEKIVETLKLAKTIVAIAKATSPEIVKKKKHKKRQRRNKKSNKKASPTLGTPTASATF